MTHGDVLGAARREHGWDVATVARRADVGVDAVVGAELGEAVPVETLRSICWVVGIDVRGRSLPVTPVDVAHGIHLHALVHLADRDAGMLMVPDVAALSKAGGWPSKEGLERRHDRWSRRIHAALGVSGCALVANFGILLHLVEQPTRFLGRHDLTHAAILGFLTFGAMTAVAMIAGGIHQDFPGRRLKALRRVGELRQAARQVGYMVTDHVLTIVTFKDGNVMRHEHRRVDLKGISMNGETKDHATVTVRFTYGTVVMPWLRPADPALAALASWTEDRQ